MRTFAIINKLVLSAWLFAISPASAHVKWFFNRPESELLKQAKPNLFTHLSVGNILPISMTMSLLFFIHLLNEKFSNSVIHRKLVFWAKKKEASINLFMAIGLGVSLIYCGITRTLLVPNFVICSHCPQWLPAAEIIVGALLILGLFSRLSGVAVLALMYMAVCKHGMLECLDALPLVGLALYFIIAGRNKYSLDYFYSIDRFSMLPAIPMAHSIVRWTMGLGLIILALDEKLLNPQLAMNLLQYVPSLNLLRIVGCSNEMFVLVSGLAELFLGICIFLGYFPRLAVVLLLVIFSATTLVFGVEEFFGHASCYGIICSILYWGNGLKVNVLDLTAVLRHCCLCSDHSRQIADIS